MYNLGVVLAVKQDNYASQSNSMITSESNSNEDTIIHMRDGRYWTRDSCARVVIT